MVGQLAFHNYPIYDVRLGPLQFWTSGHPSSNEYTVSAGGGVVLLSLLLGGLLGAWRWRRVAR